jgi:septum formation protein
MNQKQNNLLYLASGSKGRKQLLIDAQIPFELVSHSADETIVDTNQPIEVVVKKLALLKMKHVILPAGHDGQIAFVVTADTLTLNSDKKILGKPTSREHAILMLKNKKPVLVATAFCLEKKEFKNGAWQTLTSIVDYDQAYGTVDVSHDCIDLYLSKVAYMMVSGAISADGFGAQFVKEVRGCYTSIIGMPMYKFRKALQSLGYF